MASNPSWRPFRFPTPADSRHPAPCWTCRIQYCCIESSTGKSSRASRLARKRRLVSVAPLLDGAGWHRESRTEGLHDSLLHARHLHWLEDPLTTLALDACARLLRDSKNLFRQQPWARWSPETLASPTGFRNDQALMWGWYSWRMANVARPGPIAGHAASLLTLAHRLGVSFVLIDPNETEHSQLADHHLRMTPGSPRLPRLNV